MCASKFLGRVRPGGEFVWLRVTGPLGTDPPTDLISIDPCALSVDIDFEKLANRIQKLLYIRSHLHDYKILANFSFRCLVQLRQ